MLCSPVMLMMRVIETHLNVQHCPSSLHPAVQGLSAVWCLGTWERCTQTQSAQRCSPSPCTHMLKAK